jgi:hypothetical protein
VPAAVFDVPAPIVEVRAIRNEINICIQIGVGIPIRRAPGAHIQRPHNGTALSIETPVEGPEQRHVAEPQSRSRSK